MRIVSPRVFLLDNAIRRRIMGFMNTTQSTDARVIDTRTGMHVATFSADGYLVWLSMSFDARRVHTLHGSRFCWELGASK
jgi:hypothetical protein